MERSFRFTAFRYAMALPLCWVVCVLSNGMALAQFGKVTTEVVEDQPYKAQAITVAQVDCSEHSPCAAIGQQQGVAIHQLDIEGAPLIGPGQVAIVSTGAMTGLQDKAAVVKNEPYKAQAVTEMKQTLADGSHIVQTTMATVARDSDGRTVRVQKLSTMGPWKSADSSPGNSPTLTTIFDPVTKEHIDYTSDSKIAHVLLMPSAPPGAIPGVESGFSVAVPAPSGDVESGVGAMVQGFAVQSRPLSPQVNKGMEPRTESLGTKSIEGVPVTGTRFTKTIPVGTIGNDKELNIIRETWYSPELKLVIQSTQSDPRFGETTYTLKSIQQGSPDVTLFQVPADYTIDKIIPRLVKAPPAQ